MIRSAFTVCAIWLLLIARCAAQATAFPAHFDIYYALNRQGLDIAEVHWQLQPRQDQSFRYSSTSRTVGIAKVFRDEQIHEISDWRFNQGRLQSQRYQYSRSGGKRQRRTEAVFDWPRKLLHNTMNGKQWSLPLPADSYDKLNYLLALMHDLALGLQVEHYQVADGSKLKVYDIRYLAEETVATTLGPLQTQVLERTVKGSQRITRVWAAKDLYYLPVKIEHHEKGETVRLTLTELKDLDGYQALGVKTPKTD